MWFTMGLAGPGRTTPTPLLPHTHNPVEAFATAGFSHATTRAPYEVARNRSTPRTRLRVQTDGNVMALTDRLDSTPQRSHGLPCSIGALEDKLTGKEADALYAMLHTLGWSATRVYDALEAEGYHVGFQTINRHRSRACRCFKAAA